MIFSCQECGTVWSLFPTTRRVLKNKTRRRVCPDCVKALAAKK